MTPRLWMLIAIPAAYAGFVALAIRLSYRRSCICTCGHHKEFHTHHLHSIHCSKCKCGRFDPPLIRRQIT